MIHEPALIDALNSLPVTEFEGAVFRATSVNADPTAFSQNPGRWNMLSEKEGACSILYTSLVREGAIAEVASYLNLLTPVPQKPLKVHKLQVTLDRTLRVAVGNFAALGISQQLYRGRGYEQSQRVGAAINFLELDGLIAPSARWNCDNLMIFGENHSLEKELSVVGSEEITAQEWIEYADFQAYDDKA